MSNILLDAHTLIWLLAGDYLKPNALLEIAKAQEAGTLFISAISAWEVGIAALKSNPTKRPNLQGLAPDIWFKRGIRKIGAKTLPINFQIAIEAIRVPAIYGSGDRGDCYLIATARIKNLTLLARDKEMRKLKNRNPSYFKLIEC